MKQAFWYHRMASLPLIPYRTRYTVVEIQRKVVSFVSAYSHIYFGRTRTRTRLYQVDVSHSLLIKMLHQCQCGYFNRPRPFSVCPIFSFWSFFKDLFQRGKTNTAPLRPLCWATLRSPVLWQVEQELALCSMTTCSSYGHQQPKHLAICHI